MTLTVHTLHNLKDDGYLHSAGVQGILIYTLTQWNIGFSRSPLFAMQSIDLRDVIGTDLLLISLIGTLPDNTNSQGVIRNFYEEVLSFMKTLDRKWESSDWAGK